MIFLRSGPRSGVLSLFATDVATGKTRELLTAEALLASEPGGPVRRREGAARAAAHHRPGHHPLRAVPGREDAPRLAGRPALRGRPGDRREAPPARPRRARSTRASPRTASTSPSCPAASCTSSTSPRARPGRSPPGPPSGRPTASPSSSPRRRWTGARGTGGPPTRRSLAFEEADDTEVEKLSIQDPARPERRAVQFAYPRAGRQNTRVRLGVVGRGGRGPHLDRLGPGALPVPGPGALAEGRAAAARGPGPHPDRGGGAPRRSRDREDHGPPRREGRRLAEPERGRAALDARRLGLPLVHRARRRGRARAPRPGRRAALRRRSRGVRLRGAGRGLRRRRGLLPGHAR